MSSPPPPPPAAPWSPLGQLEPASHEYDVKYVPPADDVGAPLFSALAALAANRTFAAKVWARQPRA